MKVVVVVVVVVLVVLVFCMYMGGVVTMLDIPDGGNIVVKYF